MNYPRPVYPKEVCEHCGFEVGVNTFSRNHGDKCPYKDAATGFKRCNSCGEEKSLEKDFRKATAKTFDGLNQSCKECASKKVLTCPHCNKDLETKYKDHKLVISKV